MSDIRVAGAYTGKEVDRDSITAVQEAAMPDSTGGQDDAATRINGLMASMGKKEAENAALRAQLADIQAALAAQAQDQRPPAGGDSQPGDDDVDHGGGGNNGPTGGDTLDYASGWVRNEPPAPRGNNGYQRDYRPAKDLDNMSAAELRDELDSIVGAPSVIHSAWPV